MKAVFKYVIPVVDEFTMEMPKGAQILTVQAQRGVPCIWALVDPEMENEERSFVMRGTGHPIDDNMVPFLNYVGTMQMMEGTLIWHLFEKWKVMPAKPLVGRVP